ncbi:LAGLIDADG family homing endonuclease [Salinigranum sp.]|uniref:LAGLIDADG family homing endonuclease n=1 Tax=Salinigranum sp. TaxID=1966351 RepID=UPI00356A4898
MAQAPQNQELTERFIQFYRNYYRDEIGRLAQRYPNEQRSLYVDYDDLYTFDPDTAEDYLNRPEEFQRYAEEALRLYDLPADVSLGQAHVRLQNIPDSIDIRNIRVHDDHIGKLVSVQGIVRKATDVRPKITEAAFECQRCGTMTYIPQQDSGFQEPHECQGCERQGPFRVNFDQSEFVDSQKIRVQESPEDLRGGETPQSIDINIEDDITGKVTAGDHVTINGVLHIEQQTSNNEKTPIFDLYMDGVSVTIEDEEFEDMEITEEDKQEIIELSSHPDIYDEMVASVAPSIYGYDQEKLSMILQLFSGVTKHLPDGSRIRGDLHMLLIGDPGTGKCVDGDTRVTLADGTERPIRDLVESNLDDPKPVDDGVWDHVDTALPSMRPDGTFSEQRATKVWKREAPDQMYRIRTASGNELEITPSHPLFTQTDGSPVARTAETLTEGEFIATPRTLQTTGDDTLDVEYRRARSHNAAHIDLPDEWTPSLARLVGYVIAEGHVVLREDHTGDVRVTNNDEEILEDVAEALDRLGLSYTIEGPRSNKSAKRVRCNAGELASFLAGLDSAILERSDEQRVPDSIRRATRQTKREFLRAYVDSECHVSATQREVTVASMSRELLEGVRSLLLSFSITASLQPRSNGSYRLRIGGDDFQRYVEHIGFVTERKDLASRTFDELPSNTNVDVVPGIGDQLRSIRERLHLSQFECGLPRSTYQHYERGDRNPSRESLQTVIGAFEKRLGWLRETKDRIESGDWTDVSAVRDELNVSQAALSEAMGVEQTAVSYYERNEVIPDGGRVSAAQNRLLDRIEDALAVEDDVGRLRALAENDVSWDRIESIETVAPSEEWVYDLEVAGTHTYLSNNIVSHNSQMLSYIRHIAPRSVYTSGKGSSAAGLTAAAVRDDFGDGQQWTLEAGALVLADKGIAAVDELDKMRSEDRSAMHEALEQQSYHPDTEILLSDGRRVDIGTFVDEQMDRRSDEVLDGVDCEILPVDDFGVHSVDFETNETTKLPVDRISRHEAPDEFVRVEFSNGRSVTVTPEHPMFVDAGGEIGTVEARDIAAGAFVPAPRKLPNSSAAVEFDDEPHVGKERDVDLPAELTEDLAEALGLLVAEGHSYAGSSHEIGFSNQDERLLARMDQLMYDAFGLESTDTTNAAGTVTKRWVSTKLYRWFERNVPELMETARDKRIPARVLGASEAHIRRFLVGAFAGDGGVESEAMAFSTSSRGLADDYADALAKIGVASRIHYNAAEDSWKTYVMGDSTERFVDAVVDPADERYEKAQAFVERSNETRRHHDVLPTSAAREIRSLRALVGLRLTGQFRPNLDEGFGVQVETVRDQLAVIRDRIDAVRDDLSATADTDIDAIRSSIDWSGRQVADHVEELTTSAVHYAANGGYDEPKRARMATLARTAVRDALDEAERRADALEERCDLRFYRVTNVETVPNEGDHATEWVYDVTVEPTNTFVSQGVVLHNSISISKAGINATLKSRCSLLGAANPKYGRFDQYEPIGEQIDLEPALISRFDLIFTVTDQPDPEKDGDLADHILQTNYAGELNTQRTRMTNSNFTQEEVDAATEKVEPAIDPDLLRKYIAHAKRNCYPTMTDEARAAIREFYVDLRARGADEDAPVPVTARKLEALVRLAEASARVRLSDTVEAEDAERVIRIVRSCLEAIGVDPETGEFDADVIETGRSKTQRDRIKNLKGLISELESEYEEGAPLDEVLDRAETDLGLDRSKAEDELEKLRRKGEVYEPQQNHLRTT